MPSVPILAALESGRPRTAILVALSIVVPDLLFGVTPALAFLRGTTFALLAMSGFMLNDSYDVERDRVNHPQRPAARDAVTPAVLARLGIVTLIAGSFLGFIVTLMGSAATPIVVAAVGVAAYSQLSASFPIAKGALAALISITPLALVVDSHSSNWQHMLLIPAGYLFLLGRELYMDVLDCEGDFQTGLHTVAVEAGSGLTIVFARAFQIGGWTLLIPYVVSGSSFHASLTLVLGVTVVGIAAAIDPNGPKRRGRFLVNLCWVPLLVAIALLRPI